MLGLDLGLTHRLADSQGQLYGSGWSKTVDLWDAKLIALQRRLQANGLRQLNVCKAYRNAERRFSALVDNDLRRILNRWLATYRPSTVVIEDLRLSGMQRKASKTQARKLARMGTGVLKQHLFFKAQEEGFQVQMVDPAFTSQMCHACGHAHPRQRQGDTFTCSACGYTDHADLNAAKNILECFQDVSLHPSGPRRTREQVEARWIARRNATSEGVIDPCVVGHACSGNEAQTNTGALLSTDSMRSREGVDIASARGRNEEHRGGHSTRYSD